MPVRTVRLCSTALFLLSISSCTSPLSQETTKGHDIQASAPGKAQCFNTNMAEQMTGVKATNAVRSRANLFPVQANAVLANAAAAHACDMAKRGVMTHKGSSSSGPGSRVKNLGYAPRVTAENIAAGPYNAQQALAAWNASSGHLQNILIPQMQHYGIGRAIGSDGRTVYWTAVYASPR